MKLQTNVTIAILVFDYIQALSPVGMEIRYSEKYEEFFRNFKYGTP